MKKANLAPGYTLVEMIVVILIIGVLATVSVRSLKGANEVARIERTKQTLTRLAHAIAGNPDLRANGTRADFGYLGDIGSLPPNLDALVTNPGYATWKGPYIRDELSSGGSSTYFCKDAWGKDIIYNSVNLTSTGTALTRSIAQSSDQLLVNRVTVAVEDLAHTPPGSIYKDSVRVILRFPDGSGGTASRTKYPTNNGLVIIDSIPIGLHDLKVVYIPTADTLNRKVCIEPGQDVYTEVELFRKLW